MIDIRNPLITIDVWNHLASTTEIALESDEPICKDCSRSRQCLLRNRRRDVDLMKRDFVFNSTNYYFLKLNDIPEKGCFSSNRVYT